MGIEIAIAIMTLVCDCDLDFWLIFVLEFRFRFLFLFFCRRQYFWRAGEDRRGEHEPGKSDQGLAGGPHKHQGGVGQLQEQCQVGFYSLSLVIQNSKKIQNDFLSTRKEESRKKFKWNHKYITQKKLKRVQKYFFIVF